MITRRISMALACVLALCACSGSQDQDPSQWPLSRDELERNAKAADPADATYRRYCIGCHGVDGRGNGGVTGADFTRADGPFVQKSDAELATSVREGRRGTTATMPAHKPVLSDAQIDAVVAYVRKRFAPAAPTPSEQAQAPAPSDTPTPSH